MMTLFVMHLLQIRQQEYNSQVQRLERIGVSLSAVMCVIKDIHSHQQFVMRTLFFRVIFVPFVLLLIFYGSI